MNLRCALFGHVTKGRLPARCLRCDLPIGPVPVVETLAPIRLDARTVRLVALNRGEVSESEAVLLAALGEIQGFTTLHHAECRHASCIANRAIGKYWEIVLAPFEKKDES